MSNEEKILESLSMLEQWQAEICGELAGARADIGKLDGRVAALVSETRDIKHTIDGSAQYMVMTFGSPVARDWRVC